VRQSIHEEKQRQYILRRNGKLEVGDRQSVTQKSVERAGLPWPAYMPGATTGRGPDRRGVTAQGRANIIPMANKALTPRNEASAMSTT